MANSTDQSLTKAGEYRDDALRQPIKVKVFAPDQGAEGAQDVIEAHGAAISYFVNNQRERYALSTNQVQRGQQSLPELDMVYVNQINQETLYLRPRVRPSGGEKEGVFTSTSPCLMVLYGENQIAAIPMSQLSKPEKLGTVFKGKLDESLGNDPLMTAQYKFAAKGPSVVFCPINVSNKRVLTVEDAYYLSLVGPSFSPSATASGPKGSTEALRETANAELGPGGTAFVKPVKSQTSHKDGRVPVINGSNDGRTIWTPLEKFTVNKGKISEPTQAGASDALPYAISSDGDYYYWPYWSAWPHATVQLTLGYSYFRNDVEYVRYLNFHSSEDVDFTVQHIPDAGFGATVADTQDGPPRPAPDPDKATKDGKTYGWPGGIIDKVKAKTESVIQHLRPDDFVIDRIMTAFGLYIKDDTSVKDMKFAYLAEPLIPEAGPNVSNYSGQVPYPIYTPPTKSSKNDTLTTPLIDVTASDTSKLVLEIGYVSNTNPPFFPTTEFFPFETRFTYPSGLGKVSFRSTADDSAINTLKYASYPPPTWATWIVSVNDGPETLYASMTVPGGWLDGAPNHSGFATLASVNGPTQTVFATHGHISDSATIVATGPGSPLINGFRRFISFQTPSTEVQFSVQQDGPRSIAFLGVKATAPAEDTNTAGAANLLYLEPFPPSLKAENGGAYLVSETGQNPEELAPFFTIKNTRFNLNNSKLTIFTPYGEFAGQKFQPWLHVSNGQHYIQGFRVDGQSHLYLNSKVITSSLPRALGVGIEVNDIKTVIMDVPLDVIKKLR